MSRRISGFTIIELLVVIAILSLLAALILPAVQHARESARRTQCQNHLKQLGLAIQNYQASHNVYPPGAMLGGWSWRTMLLPYLDQTDRYDLVHFENNIQHPQRYYSCGPELVRIEQSTPGWWHWGPLLRCPSNPIALSSASTYMGVSGVHIPLIHPDYAPGDPIVKGPGGNVLPVQPLAAARREGRNVDDIQSGRGWRSCTEFLRKSKRRGVGLDVDNCRTAFSQ